MNTADKLNAITDYIENHITEDIDMNKLARIACCSVYDANRMFRLLSAMSITEYIRKRRMTLAGYEIQNRGLKVIDAAVKYGYDSPISFTRAFHAFHGIKPSEARNRDIVLKSFRRLVFKICVKQASKRAAKEKITVNGKVYTATYLGEADMTMWWGYYLKREYLRLENAYDDFKDCARADSVLPYSNYPVEVKEGQMFVIDYFRKFDGQVDRKYMISDGTFWGDRPSTVEINVQPTPAPEYGKAFIGTKEYKTLYLGTRDISRYSDVYSKSIFYRAENAYGDFKALHTDDRETPPDKSPEAGAERYYVIIVDYVRKDGSTERKYYFTEGDFRRGFCYIDEFTP